MFCYTHARLRSNSRPTGMEKIAPRTFLVGVALTDEKHKSAFLAVSSEANEVFFDSNRNNSGGISALSFILFFFLRRRSSVK